MSLRLVLGKAGSGKSTFIHKELSELVAENPSGSPLWLLVPEQATSQTEHALSRIGKISGLMRARVVSFQRLAYQILQEVKGAALIQVSELGRCMILRRIIEQHKKDLRAFYRSANQTGFTNKLATMISELKSYQISPEDLADILDTKEKELSPTLYNKLHDLSLLFNSLTEQYGDSYIDTNDCLRLLAENLHHSPTLKGSYIWLDGFSGFTPQEFAIIGRLLKACPQVTVCLTLPQELLQRQIGEDHVFYTPWETANRLLRLANSLGVDSTTVALDEEPKRFQNNPALLYLENSYFDRSATSYCASTQGIGMVQAANRRAEVEEAAREIVRLCRDCNYRFKDISITVRDFHDYDYLLSISLSDYGIPHFIDKKRTVEQHPALELVLAVLEAVLNNLPYEPVFRCLKTDLFPISREEVDLLENFVLAAGIRGNAWFRDEDWQPYHGFYNSEEELMAIADKQPIQEINNIRRKVALPLGSLKTALRDGKTVVDYATAIFHFIEELKVDETLNNWTEEAVTRGELDSAGLHAQVWDALIQLLDEVVAGLGSEQLSLDEFARIIESGLEAIELGLIPPELDQVVVTSLGRSRNPEVKAALVLGITEGILPARVQEDGLFTEYERQVLATLHVQLAPNAERKLFDEQFLVYTALTRASEQLWLSYPLADEEGASLMPSSVIRRVKGLFPSLKPKYIPLMPESDDAEEIISYLSHPSRALMYLTVQLREAKGGGSVPPIWWDVYSYLLESDEYASALLCILDNLEKQNAEDRLPLSIARRLYGKNLRGSVSRFEKYNACPFAYFSAYGLRLKERDIYKLAAPDLGSFFHAAMDMFVEQLGKRSLKWEDLSDSEYTILTEEIVGELGPRLQSHILDSSARFRHIARKLQRTIERSTRILGKHAQKGKFRPVAVELAYGPNGDIPGLTLKLADETVIELAGRIDRLDIAQSGANCYLRVIDYKSGTSKLTPMEVYYGLRLQLITYLHAAQTCAKEIAPEGTLPAGALYFRIHDPFHSSEAPLSDDEIIGRALESYRMSGMIVGEPEIIQLMDGGLTGKSLLIPVKLKKDGSPSKSPCVWSTEQLEVMRQHLQRLLTQTGEKIVNGNIDIAPYRIDKQTACRYCPYLPICQFDALLPENNYRMLAKLKPDEVWDSLNKLQGGDH